MGDPNDTDKAAAAPEKPAPAESALKKYRASLIIIYITGFIDLAGFGILMPLLPYHFRDLAGSTAENGQESGTLYGVVVGAFSLGQFVGSFWLGIMSDNMGRRTALLCSLFGTVFFFAATGYTNRLEFLIIVRGLAGTFAGAGSICATYIADLTTKEERPQYMAYFGATQGLGIMAGPIIGSVVGMIFGVQRGFAYASYVSASFCCINFIFAIVKFKESPIYLARKGHFEGKCSPQYRSEVRDVMRQGSMLLMLCTQFCMSFIYTTFETATVLFLANAYQLQAEYAGFVYAGYAVILASTQILAFGKLLKLLGIKGLTIACCAVACLAIGAIPSVNQLWAVFIACGVLATSHACVFNTINAIASFLARGHQGTVFGIQQSVGAASRTFSPFLAGYLYDVPNPIARYFGHPQALAFWGGGSAFALLAILCVAFMDTGEKLADVKFDKPTSSINQEGNAPTESTSLLVTEVYE